jgi:DnaJ family protein C protein 9
MSCRAVQVTYRGSAEERADLLRLYQQHSGDMGRVFDWLMLSRPDMDSHRFRDTIEAAIAAGGPGWSQ